MKTNPTSLIEAFNLGKAEAESLAIGLKFNGAMPEAVKHYKADSPEYDVFITAYVNVLKEYELQIDSRTGLIIVFQLMADRKPQGVPNKPETRSI